MLSRPRWRAWSSEGDSSEIECKDGFQKHYSVQGRSEWLRRSDDSGKRKTGRKLTVLYSGCLEFTITAFSKKDDQTTPPFVELKHGSFGSVCLSAWVHNLIGHAIDNPFYPLVPCMIDGYPSRSHDISGESSSQVSRQTRLR